MLSYKQLADKKMFKKLFFYFALLFSLTPTILNGQVFGNGGNINTLDQWTATSSPYSAITTRIPNKNIYAPYSIATTSKLYASSFCIGLVTPDCITSWPSGGGGLTSFISPNNSINIGGSLTDPTVDLNLGHENTWTTGQVFNDADVTYTPLPPASASLSFVPDGVNGIFANGTNYQYYVYSYYYDGSTYTYDSTGIFVGSYNDPNDSQLYGQLITWDTATDANGYLLYDFLTGNWYDVGNVTSFTVDSTTSWNIGGFPSLYPNSIVVPGHPVWANKSQDWGTTDFNVLAMGQSGTNHLQLRWKYTGGSGSGALRFESDDGILRTLNANLYADTIVANNSISGYIYPTTLGQNYIAYGSSGGYLTGASNFLFNPSTNRLLLSNSSITPQSQLHLHQSGATALETRYTNSASGSASTDGLQIGITSTGVGEIRQRENQAINVYVNNSLRTTWATGGEGQLIHDGSIVNTRSSIGTTDNWGLRMENQASATAGTPVQQPALWSQAGHVWDTGASATRVIGFSMGQTFTSGNPGSGVLRWGYQYNASGSWLATGFSSLMNLSSTGNLSIGNGATAGSNRLYVQGSSAELVRIHRDSGNNSALRFSNTSGSVYIGATSAGNVFSVGSTADVTADGKLYVNVSTGFVGVGTSSPTKSLTIQTGQIGAPDGSVSAPAYSFNKSGNTGLYLGASNILYIAQSGNDIMRFSNTQMIAYKNITGVNTKTYNLNYDAGSASIPSYSFNNDANTGMWSSGADILNLSTGGTDRLIIDASGNIGIATSTPAQKLDINGGLKLDTSTAQPTCNSTNRGTFWFVRNGAGVKDQVEVCAKDAGDAYAWRVIY